jgi:hypothetical protein
MVVAESLRGLPLAESSALPQRPQRFAEFPLPERGFGGVSAPDYLPVIT